MTSRPPLTKPVPTNDAGARTPCHIHPLAIVADRAQISGAHSLELGEGAVLHPYSKVRTESGRVAIGRCSSICENAVVGCTDSGMNEVTIGDYVSVEAGASVEAKIVGEGTVIEVGARIGKGATIGKYCKITALSKVAALENLPDYTVLYSDNRKRLDNSLANSIELRELKRKGQDMHTRLLKQMIPNGASKWM